MVAAAAGMVGCVILPTIGLVALVGLCADTLVPLLVRKAGEAAGQAALPPVPPSESAQQG